MPSMEKQQRYILSSRNVGKGDYLTAEKILPKKQYMIIEVVKFICWFLGKPFPKQRKTVEDQGKRKFIL